MCHSVAGSDLGTANLEDHDGLAGVRGTLQCSAERHWTSHGFKEQSDCSRALVLDMKGQPICGVTTCLRANRNDVSEANARAECKQGLRDRARTDNRRNTTIPKTRANGTHVRRRAFGDGNTHAVNPDAHRIRGIQALTHRCAGAVALLTGGFGAKPRDCENTMPRSDRLVKCRHDRACPKRDRNNIRLKRHVFDVRHAAMAGSLLTSRMHADHFAAVRTEIL